MYKIYYFDVNQKKIRSFSTIAVSITDAITRLFYTDLQEHPVYQFLKIERLKL